MSDSNGNGHDVDEEQRWLEHSARVSAVSALERRLGSLESAVRDGFRDVAMKLDLVLQRVERERSDISDLYKRWTQLIDLQLATEKRIAALEEGVTPIATARRLKAKRK